jgi:hypothetical protein
MSEAVVDVAERLMAEFEGVLSPRVVSAVVADAARCLAGPPGTLSESVEPSARRRLIELL